MQPRALENNVTKTNALTAPVIDLLKELQKTYPDLKFNITEGYPVIETNVNVGEGKTLHIQVSDNITKLYKEHPVQTDIRNEHGVITKPKVYTQRFLTESLLDSNHDPKASASAIKNLVATEPLIDRLEAIKDKAGAKFTISTKVLHGGLVDVETNMPMEKGNLKIITTGPDSFKAIGGATSVTGNLETITEHVASNAPKAANLRAAEKRAATIASRTNAETPHEAPKSPLHTTPEAPSTSGIGKAATKVAGAALKAAAPIGVATTIAEIKNEAEQNNGHGVASAAGGEVGALATMRALAKPIAEQAESITKQAKELGTAIKQIDAKQVETILSDPRLGGGKGKLLAKGVAALGTLGAAAVGAITGSKGTDAAVGDQLDAKLNPPASGTPSLENKGMEKIFGDKLEKFLSENQKSEIANIKEKLGQTANSMQHVDPTKNMNTPTASAGGKQQVAALH